MRYDLKTPCKHCPFRSDATRIKFANADRAREIAEQAYRNGFPCHLSAIHVEGGDYDSGGYVEGESSQHCIGAIIMFMKDGHDCWPGVDNDEDLVERFWGQIDLEAPVFDTEELFIDANESWRDK